MPVLCNWPSNLELAESELLSTFLTVLALSVVSWSPPNRVGKDLTCVLSPAPFPLSPTLPDDGTYL